MLINELYNQFKITQYIVVGYEASIKNKLYCESCGRQSIRMAFIIQQINNENIIYLGKKCAAKLTKQYQLIETLHKESVSLFQKRENFRGLQKWDSWNKITDEINSNGHKIPRYRKRISYDGYDVSIVENKKGKFILFINDQLINGVYYNTADEAGYGFFSMYGQSRMANIMFEYYGKGQE